MPELPEVETIKSQLRKFLIGSKIKKVEVKNKNIFQGDEEKVVNTKIVNVQRYAKVLSIDLSNGYSLLIHVKLTGQLIYKGKKLKRNIPFSKKITGGVPGPHTHVIFHLDDGNLYYNDVRRFGWIKTVETNKLKTQNKFLKNLGPEPLKDLNLKIFKQIISSSRRSIKTLLMDQTKIGGVGNIYANDALWLSKIDPKRAANTLSTAETEKLFEATEEVLKQGLKYKGASELAFVAPDGSEGKYQEHTLVYGRQGKLCRRCRGKKIKKFFISGRGTYWCENCQK